MRSSPRDQSLTAKGCQSHQLSILFSQVTDDNDNSPKFQRPKYDFTINEDEQIGAVVGQVRIESMWP